MGQALNRDVAIVTGAGRGIGRAIALSLAAEGAAVAVCARTESEIAATAEFISDAGGQAVAIRLDVRDDAAVRAAVSETESRFGRVTLVVNNAGTPGPAGLDWEVDATVWFECIDVIVRGALLLSQAVVPGMIAHGSGRIINVGSISGTRAFPAITATSIAKTALIRFSEGLAIQLEKKWNSCLRDSPRNCAHPVARLLWPPDTGRAVCRAGASRIAVCAASKRSV